MHVRGVQKDLHHQMLFLRVDTNASMPLRQQPKLC